MMDLIRLNESIQMVIDNFEILQSQQGFYILITKQGEEIERFESIAVLFTAALEHIAIVAPEAR